MLFKDWIASFEIKIKASSQKLITLVTNYKKDPKLLDKVLELDDDEDDPKANGRGQVVAKPPKAFDVWFVAANTVYKGVPYNVVADWAQQGRLAPTTWCGRPVRRSPGSRSRITSSSRTISPAPPRRKLCRRRLPTITIRSQDRPLRRRTRLAMSRPNCRTPSRFAISRRGGDEDDDVDMIPLIDISMVLLVFFIMIQRGGRTARRSTCPR